MIKGPIFVSLSSSHMSSPCVRFSLLLAFFLLLTLFFFPSPSIAPPFPVPSL